MYYRYEIRFLTENAEWEGVFQAFNPSQRRQWHCLAEPKYYENNPDAETRAWFTQHGYEKWHVKMDTIINDFLDAYGRNNYEVRLLKVDILPNIVFKGKTQCIILI